MNDSAETIDTRKAEVRHSPAGQNLTDGQFDKSWAICSIVAREIHRSGTFRDVLSDFAHAFARTERFDAMKGEEIVRDVFKARYGQTMNEMREGLIKREAEIQPMIGGEALHHARSVPNLIKEGPTMPFYRAYDQAAVNFALEQGITETGAKEMMKAVYAEYDGRELYEAGKEAEELYHKPTLKKTEEPENKPEGGFRRRKNWSRS